MASKNALPPPPYKAEPVQADGSEYHVLAGRHELHVATTYSTHKRGSAQALAEFIVECLQRRQQP